MQKDCHYYGTFLMACLAGFKKEDAEVIAWAAQTVDELDFWTVRKLLVMKYRIPFFVTVEGLADFIYGGLNPVINSAINADLPTTQFVSKYLETMSIPDWQTMLRGIWAPFHFLPGNFTGAREKNGEKMWEYNGPKAFSYAMQSANKRGDGMTIDAVGWPDNLSFTVPLAGSTWLEDMKLLCRTSTATVRRIIENARRQYVKYYQTDRIRALCAVGICMHVLADTWSHQGFAGTPSRWVNDCTLPGSRFLFINGVGDGGAFAVDIAQKFIWNVNSPVYNGHGRAGSVPDIPGIEWRIKHQYDSEEKSCKNPSRFSSGMLQMHDAMKYIRDSAGYLSDTNPEKLIDIATGGGPGFEFRTWEELKASPLEVLAALNCANPPSDILLRCFLSVLNGSLLANKAEAEADRIREWQRFLQDCSLLPDEYDFYKYDIVSFVKMARIHRAVVFRFLQDNNTRIYIDLPTVDRLVGKMMIGLKCLSESAAAAVIDASEFDDPADFAEINNIDWVAILGTQNGSAAPAPAPSAEDWNTQQNTSSKWSHIFGTLAEYVMKVGRAATPQGFYREYTGKEYSAEEVAQYLEYSVMESDMRDTMFLLADALM